VRGVAVTDFDESTYTTDTPLAVLAARARRRVLEVAPEAEVRIG